MKLTITSLFLAFILVPTALVAQLNVITSIPDLRSLVEYVGGERVNVTSIARGHEDPHHVEPRPAFITRLARADLLFVAGMELEAPWIIPLLESARNTRIIPPSGEAYIDCSVVIQPKEVPTVRVDPSMGDVHPQGNPHYFADPSNGVKVAELIRDTLTRTDPEGREYYNENYQNFRSKVIDRIRKWRARFESVDNLKVVEYHSAWIYFADFFGLDIVGKVESRPGIPPTGRDLARITETMKSNNVRTILRESFQPDRFSETIASRVDGQVVVLPAMVGAKDGIDDYLSFIDYLVNTTVNALKEQ